MSTDINYNSVGVVELPLGQQIIIKKEKYNFSPCAQLVTMSDDLWSQESASEWLLGGGFTLWALV